MIEVVGAESGVRRLSGLIWRKDPEVRKRVCEAFKRLYIDSAGLDSDDPPPPTDAPLVEEEEEGPNKAARAKSKVTSLSDSSRGRAATALFDVSTNFQIP